MKNKSLFKALGLVFALLLVFTFSACSDDDTGGGGDTTAPTWTAVPAPSGTAGTNTASISFTLNEAGTVFWKVMANGAEAPSSSQVTNDNNFRLASSGEPGTIDLTGLNANTAYDVFVVAKDNAGNLQAAPVKVDITTASNSGGGGDTTAPSWTADPAVSGTPETNSAYVAYTLDEVCTVSYVVLPNGATAPSAADVKTNGNRNYSTAGVQDQVWLQNLSTGTTYNVYFVATDAANNNSVVKMAVVTTASGGGDTTPPSWTSAPAPSGTIGQANFTIGLTTDENATVFYQLLADGSPAPTAAYLRDNAPSIAATGGSPATIDFVGLTAGTAYDVYVVAQDATGNLQATPTLVEVTTASGGGTPWVASNSDLEGDLTIGAYSFKASAPAVTYSTADAHTGSRSILISGTAGSSNGYLFSFAGINPIGSYTKIVFYIKGTVGGTKSLSVNLNGSAAPFYNLGAVGSTDISIGSSALNDYTGPIDTGGSWVKVTLTNVLATPTDIAFKFGKTGVYDLHIDDIHYE